MSVPKLSADSAGRIHGVNVSYNSPWPTVNGDAGEMSVPSGIMGVIMHTMVGNLPGTISWFNNPEAEASAHFGVDQSGNIHQFGPVTGWKAWAEEDGNPNWYSIEFADNENPDNPLTAAQINAGGQLLEVLSRVGNFPLQLSNSVNTEGFGWHGMGGVAWGDHLDCPGDVRKAQRSAVLAVAEAIRTPAPTPTPVPAPIEEVEDMGNISIDESAKAVGFNEGQYKSITFFADPSVIGKGNQSVRVAVHSHTKGFSQIVVVTNVGANKTGVTFSETDVNGVSLMRQGGADAWADVAYYLN